MFPILAGAAVLKVSQRDFALAVFVWLVPLGAQQKRLAP